MTLGINSRLGPAAVGALSIAVAGVGGCSYAPPQLSVTGAHITEETPEGIVVRFQLDALNTNSVELPLREVHYTLMIDGQPVFSGLRSPEASLRRLGTQQISFT